MDNRARTITIGEDFVGRIEFDLALRGRVVVLVPPEILHPFF